MPLHPDDMPPLSGNFPLKETAMFKTIGAVVVYGFALLGLAKYLEALHGEQTDK